jgi:hypothetical protein
VVSRKFPQSQHANAELVSTLGHDCFFPIHFQFMIRLSPCHPTLYSLAIDKSRKMAPNTKIESSYLKIFKTVISQYCLCDLVECSSLYENRTGICIYISMYDKNSKRNKQKIQFFTKYYVYKNTTNRSLIFTHFRNVFQFNFQYYSVYTMIGLTLYFHYHLYLKVNWSCN